MRPSAAALSSQKEVRGIMKIHLPSNFIIMQIKQPSNLIITLYSITICTHRGEKCVAGPNPLNPFQ